MSLMVVRCDEVPVPYVESIRVKCRSCDTDCWLSKSTGAGSRALSMIVAGDADCVCSCCMGFCCAETHGKPDA